MRPWWSGVERAIGGLALTGLAIAAAFAQPTQPVYLQYDGYVRNADGTLTLSFGYFNTNNVDVTVPPGDANTFTPAPGDRNQPIAFLKGRHRFACSMVVDKNFDGRLQWTVKFAGKSQTTTAKTLDPLYELELNSQKRATHGIETASAARNVCVNRPPVVQIASGPFGEPTPEGKPIELAAKVGQPLRVNGHIDDDGLPRGRSLIVAWKKLTGPGAVAFSDAAAGPTTMTFDAPGAYEIELSASDGDRATTLKVHVTVT